MGFCPYYSKTCPQNIECQLWDNDATQCGVILQKTVLQQILATGGETSVVSIPPSGYCKVSNLYVNLSTGKLEVIYDNTPVE